MTKTDIGIYRGLKEKFDPTVHVGFFITTDTGELLLGDQSLGQAIADWEIEDGVLTLKLNTGEDIRITFPEATGVAKGLLSAEDKVQLTNLADNLDSKVDKVTGKSLVADSEITKLAGLPNSNDLTDLISNAKAAGDQAQIDINAHKALTNNPHSVTKAQVGLGNVTDDAQVKRAEMGVANGVATLDENGTVPASQLPSYVDDVLEFAKKDNFPSTGETGKIYVALDTNLTYRWSGSAYVEISQSLALGETSSTAYAGDKGAANAADIASIKGTALSHIDDNTPITTDVDKVTLNYKCYTGTQYGGEGTTHTADIPAATATNAGVMSKADKVKLDGMGTAISDAVAALDSNATSTDGTNVQVKVTEVDGKITAVNITKDETAKNADLTAEVTRAKAAEGAIQTALDDHKADKDKKHIPTGGHERQILSWKADGEAQWENIANMFTGLEELLAYGVEWDTTVADPHLTRIGNMSLHKTLPIQSQLKGCIAQEDKVIYWLDENDWRFRKDATTISVTPTEDDATVLEVASTTGLGVNQYLRSGDVMARIIAVDKDASTITVEWILPEVGEDEEPFDTTTITSLEVGSRLDGYHGTVRVYCPNFYIKSVIAGNKRRVWLSTVKVDNTWVYQPEILLDAYRSTVLNTVGATLAANGTIEEESYLATLPVNSAISVVNTAAYCRGGGNRTANDKYLEGVEATEDTEAVEKDIFRTDLGKPRTSLPRSSMRTYARNAGNEMLSYNQYKNIFYWLWVVEYANFNCQEAFNADLTTEGYRQGGMGAGITNMNNWGLYNGYYPLTPCGYCNHLGNGTGIVKIVIPEFTYGSGTVKAAQTMYVPRWRGFDNPFGDIWTNLDGIIINSSSTTKDGVEYSEVYTTDDPSLYSDSNWLAMEKAGEEYNADGGYIKEFDLGETAEIIPESNGGDTTKYKCDYHYTDPSKGCRTLLVGGHAHDGAYAGLGYFDSGGGVSFSYASVGFRSVSSFLSFLDN